MHFYVLLSQICLGQRIPLEAREVDSLILVICQRYAPEFVELMYQWHQHALFSAETTESYVVIFALAISDFLFFCPFKVLLKTISLVPGQSGFK